MLSTRRRIGTWYRKWTGRREKRWYPRSVRGRWSAPMKGPMARPTASTSRPWPVPPSGIVRRPRNGQFWWLRRKGAGTGRWARRGMLSHPVGTNTDRPTVGPLLRRKLTKTMPQGLALMPPVRLHHDRTTSEWETTGLEPGEGEQGLEVKTPSLPTESRPEWTPMLELCSEDEEDPLSWEKYLASLAHKEQAHTESLQHLAPLSNMPESAPESQADNITNTPEAESEPAEAHELTGEGTTNTTDPTTSDGFTEGDEGDGDIDYDELEAMYHGAPMCQDDQHEGILPSVAPEYHQVPSPPTATLDEPGAGTSMAPDAPTVSPLEAMLDEPEADAGTMPDASPATELRLLQSPEQEQATLRRDTPSAEQAEHSPQWVESSPLPSDASPPGSRLLLIRNTTFARPGNWIFIDQPVGRGEWWEQHRRSGCPRQGWQHQNDSYRTGHWCLPHGNWVNWGECVVSTLVRKRITVDSDIDSLTGADPRTDRLEMW